MNKRKYHYEYFLYTDNLCWGRMLLGRGRTPGEARMNSRFLPGGYGATVLLKRRVYDN